MARRQTALPADPRRASWNGEPVLARGRLEAQRCWDLVTDVAAVARLALRLDDTSVLIMGKHSGTAKAKLQTLFAHDLEHACQKALDVIVPHCCPWNESKSAHNAWTITSKAPCSATLRAIEATRRVDVVEERLERLSGYLRERGRGNLARRIETMTRDEIR